MNVIPCEQHTPEWYAIRAGKVTASRICDVMAKIKSGEAASRRNYKAQIVAELLTGQSQENGYVSREMERGTEYEPLARAAYELKMGSSIEQIGFVVHPTIERAGASPDGIDQANGGLIEIKCPNTATHIGHWLTGNVVSEYRDQMQFQMDCCGLGWCDFISYDDRMPEHLRLYIWRFGRDDIRIAQIREEVEKFLAEVDDMIARLPREGESDPLNRQLRESLQYAQARSAGKSTGEMTKLVDSGDKITLPSGEVVKAPF